MVAVPALEEVVPEALDPDGLPVQDGPRVEMVVDPEALIAARVRVCRVRAVGCPVARAAAARPARPPPPPLTTHLNLSLPSQQHPLSTPS